MSLKEFVKQPIDGMLYDLNRGETVILTFIDDIKWINDFAATKVLRHFYEKTLELQSMMETQNITLSLPDWTFDNVNRPQ